MPSLHWPLPPLEQEAFLSVGLLHAGRHPPETLHNLPAILKGDAGKTQNKMDNQQRIGKESMCVNYSFSLFNLCS